MGVCHQLLGGQESWRVIINNMFETTTFSSIYVYLYVPRFGFVEMGSEKEAMEAAKALNGTKLLGRQVFVSNDLSFACFVGVDCFLLAPKVLLQCL